MSEPTSPTLQTPSVASVQPEAIAAAAERRCQENPLQNNVNYQQDYEKRQNFRRLLDPGIMRPNGYPTAMQSIKTLLTIADNLLREPDNPKYQRFKPTNSSIKARLIDPRGALEYAIALGFRPEVENFQPYYTFDRRKLHDLHIGATILRDYLELETRKREREEQSRKAAKAASEAVADKVKLAFLDDRKTKSLWDEREKERLAARAAVAAQGDATRATSSSTPTSPVKMALMENGAGHSAADDD